MVDQSPAAGRPLLIDRRKAALIVVDAQERLADAADGAEPVLARISALVSGARIMDVPVILTEQCGPQNGGVFAELVDAAGGARVVPKTAFKATAELAFTAHLVNLGRPQLVVAGFEAHISVLQTVLGLLGSDRQVFVVADAVAARRGSDCIAALRRMAATGAQEVTSDMVLHEWLETGDNRRGAQLAPHLKSLADL
jgi:nicotinamidase-related amidase